MRQLFVEVHESEAERLTDILDRYEVLATWRIDMEYEGEHTQLVILHTSNANVGNVIEDLSALEGTKVTLDPGDMLLFKSPFGETTTETIDLQDLSPIEVYLGGLQSIGSWHSYLAYAVAAAIVVWIALFTGSMVPLIAAVLIAPFGGPAMNVALGTARGDGILLVRSLSRYAIGLLAAIGVCALLSLILQQTELTDLMLQSTSVSAVAFLLPLATGAVGAHNLFQSEGSSLVPGTAVGALVAASLIPPAGAIGMAVATGQWALVDNGVFLLLLQLVTINLGGTIVFRLYGVKASDSHYQHGRKWLLPVAAGISLAILGGLLFWQYSQPTFMVSSSRAQRIAADIRDVVEESDNVEMLDIDVLLTKEGNTEANTFLAIVYVERTYETGIPTEIIRDQLHRKVSQLSRDTPDAEIALSLFIVE